MKLEQFGPYSLIRPIATGGMGELYLAQRAGIAGFSKQLVVKRIRPELLHNREFTEMFLNEGRVAAFLDHPNIVHIYDLGEVDGTFFLAMEYVAGKDLGTLLKAQQGPLPLSAALYVISAICEGIHFAHEMVSPRGEPMQLVHRDLNPQNVLLSFSGAVKIADFGIAKVKMRHRQETRVGILKGKFGYLSPEQARGSKIDRRSDIYALGLLLFETTVGQRAITGRTESELLYAAVEGMTLSPSKLIPDYPTGLEQIYLKATAKRPEQRYQTVKELQNDLLAFQLESRLLVSSSELVNLMQGYFSKEMELDRRALSPQDTAGVTRTEAIDSGQFEQKPAAPGGLEPKPTTLDRPTAEQSVSQPAAPAAAGSDAGQRYANSVGGLQGGLQGVKTEPYTPQEGGPYDLPAEPYNPVNDTYNPPTAIYNPELARAQTQLQQNHGAQLNERQTLLRQMAALETSVKPERSKHPPGRPPAYAMAGDKRRQGRIQTEEVLEPVNPPPGPGIRLVLSAVVLLLIGAGGIYLASGAGAPALDALRSWFGKVEATETVDGTVPAADLAHAYPSSAPSSPEDAGLIRDGSPAVLTAADLAGADLAADLTPQGSPPPDRPAAPTRAKLQLTVTPQVTVYWRGKKLGRTPLHVSLPPGRHQLQLRDPATQIAISRTISLRGGQRQSLDWSLEKGALLVKARPWAYVEVNGRRRGTTPMPPLELYEGSYKIRLVNDAKGAPHQTTVKIRPGQTTQLIHAF